MFNIGEFSKLAQVTTRQLRFYDELGLLVPERTDANGRRYYAASQLARLHRILALKDLGFSLEQVRGLLADHIPVEELRGMLRLRQAESERRAQDELRRHRAIGARLDHLERFDDDPLSVILKRVPEVTWLRTRATVASLADAGALFEHVTATLGTRAFEKQGFFMAVVRSPGLLEEGVDVEAGRALRGPVSEAAVREAPAFEVKALPAVEDTACVVHQGSHDRLLLAYGMLGRWLEREGYRIDGPTREVLLQVPRETDGSDAVTEVQLPVRHVGASTERSGLTAPGRA